ncbi:MAG: BamA/TamA family outer membrane protein, partial [Pseudomonadota bacterium]
MHKIISLRVWKPCLFLFCYLLSPGSFASLDGISVDAFGQRIDLINISGNQRSQEKYVLKWSGLAVGQLFEKQLLNAARQELMDTGLFKQVSFQSEEQSDGRLALHILLEEKRYTLLLPRLSRNGDGDVKVGIRLRMHNLAGADQTLSALIQKEEEEDGDDSELIRLRYRMPLYDLPYTLSWRLSHEIENTEEENFNNIETSNFISMGVSRDWDIDSLAIPLTVATSISFEQRKLDRPYPDDIEAREAGDFNRLSLALIYDDAHREKYRRYGSFYQISLARGFNALGSDYESNILTIEAIRFIRLNRGDNFNFWVVTAFSHDSPYDYLRYSIGGASNLRGLEDEDERGDARVFSNWEYIVAYKRYPGVRHTFFIDIGNVYKTASDIDLTELHYTIGT